MYLSNNTITLVTLFLLIIKALGVTCNKCNSVLHCYSVTLYLLIIKALGVTSVNVVL